MSGYTNFVLTSHLYNQHLISTIIILLQSYHYLISTIIISSLQLSYNLYDQYLISTINISSLQLSYYCNRIISILSTVSLQIILLIISTDQAIFTTILTYYLYRTIRSYSSSSKLKDRNSPVFMNETPNQQALQKKDDVIEKGNLDGGSLHSIDSNR